MHSNKKSIRGGKMRIAMRVLLILTLLTAMSFGAEQSRRVVLESANLGHQALEKTVSNTSETGFSFRLAGIDLSDVAVSERTCQKITAISDTPEKFGETGEEGLPDLPVYSELVAIPDLEGVRAEIISSSYQTIEDVDAYPFQPPPVDEESGVEAPFTKDDNFYQTDQFYPPEIVSLGEPIICRDLRMIQSVVNPVQYNPVRRELRVYTNIDYRLVYEGTDTRNAKIRHDNHISETFLSMYRALVPNADEMLADYEPIRGGYLIIAPNAYPDSLIQVLAQWKHLKGYSVVVARAVDINPGGNPSNTQVFSYIQNAYNTWAVPPEFVCIIGDVGDGIPDYGFGGYTSDHHYGCVDGSDYFLDVFVNRISVNNSFPTVRVALYKPVIYEKTPYMGDAAYWLRGLCAAANITSGSLPSVTPRLNVLWAREMMMRQGFTQVDTTFAWSGYNPGPGAAIASLNNGVSIINYRGWGSSSCWGGPNLCISDLEALSGNNKMGIMASLTCGTGEYGYSECFTEKWIRMGSLPSALKGGPGSYGATESGTHTKYNNPIMIGYVWAFTNQDIYNFTLAAFMGKVELYNTFPRANGPGSWVERYCHTFNPLGEPEFEMRTATPQTMLVTYPGTIPVGTSMLTVHVSQSGGAPLEGAYVNLVKGRSTEEVFVGGRTDALGNITLDFSTTTADTMFVTVTARNYVPHVRYTIVEAQPVAVNINSIALDDDNSGGSHGNSDGNANPSETIEFDITLRNFGNSTTATNVSASLSSLDPNVFITVPNQSYGSIAPGATAASGKFAAILSPDIPQGEHYILRLNIASDQGSWTGAVPVDIKNMRMSVTTLEYPGNPNNRIDPGETSDLVINLRNTGELAGTALSGVLTTSDTGVVIIDGTANFGDIGIGAIGSNAVSPFVIQARSRVYQGRNVNFNLALTSSNGSIVQRPFFLVVGNISTYDPIGPDSYGYYLYDNTDGSYTACPIYNWVEISPYLGGSGTRINFPFSTDDDAVVIGLPFAFRYYGQNHIYALVSINGFIAFDTTRFDMQGHHWSAFDNGQIPEPSAPDGIIAPFWDDLEYTGNNGVFRYYDSANHRFIIEWAGCTHPRSLSTETFEMIIYDQAYYPTPTGDCEMLFQYNVVHNDDNDTWDYGEAPGLYSTVGIQNYRNDDGLEYTYDNLYHPGAAVLQTGRAIKVTTVIGMQPPPEIAYDPSAFVKSAQVGQVVTDTLTISNISGGLLNFNLSEFTDNRLLGGNDKDAAEPVTTAVAEPIGYVDDADAKPGDEHQPIYPPVILNHGGPDTYGNMWVDSDEGGGPSYNWVDISDIGTPANITSDDGYVGPISMGINFSFYGNTYSTIFINANGILTFGTGTGSYSNQVIPSSGAPNNFIAPLWDDLSPQNGGSVMYYHDAVNNRFIVSYTNTPFYSGGGNVNFEAILYPSGRILFEYASLDGGTRGLNSCTIGIENSDGSDGLQVVYNADYLHNDMAVMIYPPNFWLVSNLHTASLLAGQDTMAIITFDATNLTAGTYTGHLDLDSNDPINGSVDIPVSFTVGGGGTPNIVQTPSSFTDTLQTGQSAPFNIKVRNTGSAVLTVAFSTGTAWISTIAGPYNISVGDSLIHSVTLNATGLTPETYNGSVITTTNDPVHPTVTLPVQLLVTAPPPPNISYHPSAINDTLIQGATILWDLTISNTGGSPLNLALSAVEGSLILASNGNSGTASPVMLSDGDGGDEPPHILNDWLFISPAADTIAVNDSLVAEVTLTATVVTPGTYTGHIALVSNDPDTPNASVPVTILVQIGGAGCEYVIGDANNNGAFNGLDVTYSVAYFKGGPPPPYDCECPDGSGNTWYVAGDVNASCSFNGLDVTYMVAYFKGGPIPRPCPDCPPTLFLDGNQQQGPIESGQ
jgi:hypothetical protein